MRRNGFANQKKRQVVAKVVAVVLKKIVRTDSFKNILINNLLNSCLNVFCICLTGKSFLTFAELYH